ncbi:MAG: YfiR family protein [Acidobacteriota bacterium]|nr:YfiR family protein [Acidobacteriota bacterium]
MPRLLRAVAITAALPLIVSGQAVSVHALKAAFLFNFAKFTEWPAHALSPGEPLVLCVVNDPDVGQSLAELTKGRVLDGHALVVWTLKPDSSALAACRLLFLSGLDSTRSKALLESLAGRPILTVSDLGRFAEGGGVAGFFEERGSMRFAINLDAARRASIQLSSKLLSLARIVKDDRATPR